jgi:hypothetical protein
MNTDPVPSSFIISPKLKIALVAVALIAAMPMAFICPIAIYANTLPPGPPGGVFNAQTFASLGMKAMGFAGAGILWAGYVLIGQRPQWKVSPEGIEVWRRGAVVRHLSWSEVRSLKVTAMTTVVVTLNRVERLPLVSQSDVATLKEHCARSQASDG